MGIFQKGNIVERAKPFGKMGDIKRGYLRTIQ